MPTRILILSLVGLICLPSCFIQASEPKATPKKVVFARDIQPLFASRCLHCHGPDQAEAGLRLDIAEQSSAELPSGVRAIAPGQPKESELLRRVTSTRGSERMPPEGEPLTAKQIEQLEQWIAAGATYETHWAYRPIQPPALPSVHHASWVRQPLDHFVLAQLEAKGIPPSPEADRSTLIRRLYYDLLGLPPPPTEVDTFCQDPRPDAYARLVDRLLASEHFGERWGRHWLDKARFADSDGYEKDRPRPNAWRYRDWVIDAINQDMPFDQFTIEQLAGDLLLDASPEQRLATAFHRQTLTNTEGGTDQEEFRVEATFDRTETTAAIWMGLTMNCARCHSHKYDQIRQQEYYQLFAFFNNANEATSQVVRSTKALIKYQHQQTMYQARLRASQRRIADAVVGRDPLMLTLLAWQRLDLLAHPPKPPTMKVRVLSAAKRKTHVLHRGDFLQPEAEVTPNALQVIKRVHPLHSRHPDQAADRLDLARWLVDQQHPLTPRVVVNHTWAHLFGQGLVRTVNDFGVRGEPPTHPQLLDWLAWHFPRSLGWRRKPLIRTILLSATYRQSSNHRPELRSIDPTNRLLARQNRLRVEGEIIRDLHLAVAGLLDRRIGGPSVFPPLPPGIAELSYANSFKWNPSTGSDRYRRGMYTFFKRTAPHPNLISFDCPDANTTKLKRDASNTPLQALVTLNNEVFHEAAEAMAQRILAEQDTDDHARLRFALRLCIARQPSPQEVRRFHTLLEVARQYYANHPQDAAQLIARHPAANLPAPENAAWVATVRMVLNLDEFVVRD